MVPVLIAARRAGVRAALCQLLEDSPGARPIAAASSIADLFRLLARTQAPVVVIDEPLVADHDLQALRTLAAAAPHASFIMVGMHDHPAYVKRARDAGAADYVCLDDVERLAPAVMAASERSSLVPPARRRAGSLAVRLVPAPGADSISSVPPSNSTRSRIPSRP
jgi:DNA-binding NarL/FixJ family response regulator